MLYVCADTQNKGRNDDLEQLFFLPESLFVRKDRLDDDVGYLPWDVVVVVVVLLLAVSACCRHARLSCPICDDVTVSTYANLVSVEVRNRTWFFTLFKSSTHWGLKYSSEDRYVQQYIVHSFILLQIYFSACTILQYTGGIFSILYSIRTFDSP